MEENKPKPDQLQVFEGTVENIVYASESGDYVVARFQPESEAQQITIVGSMMSLRAGERL